MPSIRVNRDGPPCVRHSSQVMIGLIEDDWKKYRLNKTIVDNLSAAQLRPCNTQESLQMALYEDSLALEKSGILMAKTESMEALKHAFAMTMIGFGSFKELVPELIVAMARHRETGEILNPNVFISKFPSFCPIDTL